MPPLAPPDPATLDDLTGAERAALATLREADEWGSGYSAQQSTRPQTVGYGLVDSPAALCAWIVEKFWSWTDSGGDLHRVSTRDELLDNLMLYWLPGSGASSARLYRESLRQVNEWISGSAVGGAPVPEHPVLERARQGRPLRDVRAAGVVRRRGPVILPAGPLMVTRSR
ncbi:hypothetical protein [Saccharothrix variisporea]|uniref:hypothetical protein n=1 Tax=Saccharothrix variisporea TaxID=543527 RepID=UPI001FE5DB37|nr:hypothetical protein [Saccharothrix variisporea]